ncbi:hypothetical protein VTO42DRAFT_4944 [Malbranchea cinnamomea]
MLPQDTVLLVVNGIGLALVVLASIPAIRAIARRCQLLKSTTTRIDYPSLRGIYRDEDGAATEESVRAFSDQVQRWSIAVLSLAGLSLSLAAAVIQTVADNHHSKSTIVVWLQFAFWVFLSVQSAALFAEPWPTKRFTLGIYNSLSCIALLATVILQHLVFLNDFWRVTVRSKSARAERDLNVAQTAAAFLIAIASLLIPRRPDVFRNGKVVDKQFTTSFLSRLSFAWADHLLGYTIKNRGLEVADLPELDYANRSKTLRESFDKTRREGERLWKTLVREYSAPLALQTALVVSSAALSFTPQYCLLGILRTMENHHSNPTHSWLWVISLGASILIYTTIESWLFWIVFYRLGIPVYEQLSAVIFAKSMRRKDVKGSQKSKAETAHSPPQQSMFPENDEEGAQKTRQAAINLVAVDAKRVSDFAAFNYIVIATIVKLTVAFTFLVRLIGWRSLGAGLLASTIITPMNVFAARRYTGAQTALMKHRDQKMEVVNEVLQGIRQIKFSAMEDQWEKKIWDIRNIELQAQWTAFVYDIALIGIWIMGPVMLSAVSLGVYSILHGELSASVAFTTMSVFSSIEFALAILPELIADFIEAWVSAGRIEKHLESAERVRTTVPGDTISFEQATVAWPADASDDNPERFTLQNLNLNFPRGALSVISGRTGSGKSLLLASILGEAEILEGTVQVPLPPPMEKRFDDQAHRGNWIIDSAIAYVAQVPWIENASIKDNILFGLPLDEERYQKVIFACALEKDFEMLPDGELTDIGANGVNLSGGQKWRVSFARALYSRAGILIMDDIFSALDAHTGRHLHVHALTGELCRGRTRILVTHHVGLCLPQADYSVHLEDGVVRHAGSMEELRKTGILKDILSQEDEAHHPDGEDKAGQPKVTVTDTIEAEEDAHSLERVLSHRSQVDGPSAAKPQPKKFQQDEKRETGSIKLQHYITYMRSGGSFFYWACIFLIFCIYASLHLSRSWWVNIWTRQSGTSTSDQHLDVWFHVLKLSAAAEHESNHSLSFYLGIYVLLSVSICVVGALRFALLLSAAIKSSRALFQKLTFAVLRAPLRWLDTVPVGRILNRFTSDFNMVDSRLPYDFGFMLYQGLQVVGIVVAGVLVSPLLSVFAACLLTVCLYYAHRFLAGAREIKRLESNAKSPVYEQFGSALIGLSTIRAFDKAQTYVERMYAKIDQHCQAYTNLWLFNRWLSFRMNVIGAVFSLITAAVIVSIKGINASLAGFALSFALQYNAAIAWALRLYANVELDMNATERVVEYASIEVENQGGVDAPAAWPTEGRLEVHDLVVGYAPDLPPVLRGLTFTVEKNQRVGVVGRTGAGKSSLTLALFRFLEAREGTIHIDGVDISKIKLRDLRSRLAIIPQDPVLFSGTIRTNLDPFDEYTDAELRDALERVHLITSSSSPSPSPLTPSPSQSPAGPGSSTATAASSTTATAVSANNTNIFTSLDSSVSEGGLNLSQGQRQLLCLARAIVSRPKIMVLDEATSAVDMDTDALIQRSIRSEFGRNSTTLLVIAHRLSTIADFDKILVMDAGRAVEFGSPRELLEIEGGMFRGLVSESGEREELERIILGGEKSH